MTLLMLNMKLLAGELAYGMLFCMLFYYYIKLQKGRRESKAVRREGILLLALHSVLLFALIFFAPDLYMPSLIRLALVIPAACSRYV